MGVGIEPYCYFVLYVKKKKRKKKHSENQETSTSVTFDLDRKSGSNRLMSFDVAYSVIVL